MSKIIENIVTLRGMIEACPETSFNLLTFKAVKECGTLYCSVGLAACQPYFIEQGLTLSERGALLIYGRDIWQSNSMQNIDEIFGEDSFEKMFHPRNEGCFDEKHPSFYGVQYSEGYTEYLIHDSVSDKHLALWRIDRVLEEMKGK